VTAPSSPRPGVACRALELVYVLLFAALAIYLAADALASFISIVKAAL
jgi:hypothetical protein